ncbi:MAG: hypothetical protein COT25_02535 [Candidatus Kerfeldbacteria bacterium CG08_land_8_20_14_0_20_42_7]|uniref:Uncharacterized protein n=1 Tax=Candidatus Kerfeldbacteria bacterium CG08_land_8_20_14_0_20_42_7 TaxID=2014245 RepID=A0A2H0YUY2_9BACT|nr:MAG: hypothetical protein COT25_02535 [Candidatus Kerfeldbacteria bacterium CG08_land_8_20_14_0_20_42_7]
MKTVQDVEAEVCYAYQEVTGIFPEDVQMYHCENAQVCSGLSGLISEKLGVFVSLSTDYTLAEYAIEVHNALQSKEM